MAMDPITFVDLAFYSCLCLCLAFCDCGSWLDFGSIMARAVPFFGLRLPLRLFHERVLRNYDDRSSYSRRSSLLEHILVESIKYGLMNFDSDFLRRTFLSRRAFSWLYSFRRFRNGGAGVGDCVCQSLIAPNDIHSLSTPEIKGLWFRSASRGSDHDVIIYYIHGGGFVGASVYCYMEFLAMYLNSLHDQGLKNPAIFAVDYTSTASYSEQLNEVANAWNHLSNKYKSSCLLLSGDSNGASLGLGLLLHISIPCPLVETICYRKPLAAFLISPVPRFSTRVHRNRSDYVTDNLVQKYASTLHITEMDYFYACPGGCQSKEWWRNALPSCGTYILSGASEVLAGDTMEFHAFLKSCGYVKLELWPDQIHSWPVLMTFVGQDRSSRTEGLYLLSSHIAATLLWRLNSMKHNPASSILF